MRNKIFNYKNTVKNINTKNTTTYRTGIISCNCTNTKYLNHHHLRITKHLRIIDNKELPKIISKGPNYRKPKNINWGKRVRKASWRA